MIEANKFKLGMFVVSACVLFLAAIFVFGLSDMFRHSVVVFSVFSDSVQGLSVGSPVKFKGVPVGQVKKILIRGEDEHILVFMELDLTVYSKGSDGNQFGSEEFEKFYQIQMKRGLTCGLELAGITGMKYVELDYVSGAKDFKPLPRPNGVKGFYIPSRPSVIQNIIKMINKSLSSIAGLQLDKLSNEARGVLKGANDLFNDGKLKNTITKIHEVVVNIDRAVKEVIEDPGVKRSIKRLDGITANLDTGLNNINSSLSKERLNKLYEIVKRDLEDVNALISQVRSDIDKLKLPKTVKAIRTSAEAVADSKIAVLLTLQRLNKTLESVADLVSSIEDDPSSLIKGKHKKPLTGANGEILPKYIK